MVKPISPFFVTVFGIGSTVPTIDLTQSSSDWQTTFPFPPIIRATDTPNWRFIAAVFGTRSICQPINFKLRSLVFQLTNPSPQITTATLALILLFIETEFGICSEAHKALLRFNLDYQRTSLFRLIMTEMEKPI